jgi:hypothetical protein
MLITLFEVKSILSFFLPKKENGLATSWNIYLNSIIDLTWN